MCVQKKIVIERTRDLIYLKFVESSCINSKSTTTITTNNIDLDNYVYHRYSHAILKLMGYFLVINYDLLEVK